MAAIKIEIGGTVEQAQYAYNFYKQAYEAANMFSDPNQLEAAANALEYINDQIRVWTNTKNRPADIYSAGFEVASNALNVIDRSIMRNICGSALVRPILNAVIKEARAYFHLHGLWFYTTDQDAKYIIQLEDAYYAHGPSIRLCVHCSAPIAQMVTNNGVPCVLITPDFEDYTQGNKEGHIFGIQRCKSIFTLNNNSDLVYKDQFKITYTGDTLNLYIVSPPESMRETQSSSMFYFPRVCTQFGNYYMVDALFSPKGTKIILGDLKICAYKDGQYLSASGPAIDYHTQVIKRTLQPGELYYSQHGNVYKNMNSEPIEEITIYTIEGRHFVATDGLILVRSPLVRLSVGIAVAAVGILIGAILGGL